MADHDVEARASIANDDKESVSSPQEDVEPIESLVEGRQRRSTAGNRLSTLLDKEADDDLELLFAEQDDDVEFESEAHGDEEDQSDVGFGSSDEDEVDHGPQAAGAAGEEDLEGEQELQREAKANRLAQKRKAQKPFFKAPRVRKKVKIDVAGEIAGEAENPNDGKKAVARKPPRAAADLGDATVRQSSRRATVRSKAMTTARLKEHEAKRLRQIASMEVAAKRREAEQSKTMTQADRLVEAERVEKQNSKSLNRWEEAERKRSEEQKARLAALQNRQLDGPVISWLSSAAQWVNGRLCRVGKRIYVEDVTADEESKGPSASKIIHQQASFDPQSIGLSKISSGSQALDEAAQPAPRLEAARSHQPMDLLDGINLYAGNHADGSKSPLDHSIGPNLTSGNVHPPSQTSEAPASTIEDLTIHSRHPPLADRSRSTRNLLLLKNFDHHALKNIDTQRRILFKRYSKAPKFSRNLCAITAQPARFRDPTTGLPFSNGRALREIFKLKEEKYPWSDFLGCYVGSPDIVARGVPDRFRLVTGSRSSRNG